MEQILIDIQEKFKELEEKLNDPKIFKDRTKFKNISKEYSKLEKIITLINKLKDTEEELESITALSKEETNKQMLGLYNEEEQNLQKNISSIKNRIQELLTKNDKDDNKNAIIEIRAGTGGEEASLFAKELFRMYARYAEKNDWNITITNSHYTGTGGIKEIIAIIEGGGVFGKLKYESGVHRVQRVPTTESSGRLHTSAVSVVILPEIEDNEEIEIKDSDIKIDVYRATGPGGQSVNTTDSAVRITHLPTGIVVTCQDEKSQHKNKKRALKILKSKLYQLEKAKTMQKVSDKRRQAIKSGDRSEKIRTYNFPQQRVSDHRIKKSWFNLEDILNGDIEQIISDTHKLLNDTQK